MVIKLQKHAKQWQFYIIFKEFWAKDFTWATTVEALIANNLVTFRSGEPRQSPKA